MKTPTADPGAQATAQSDETGSGLPQRAPRASGRGLGNWFTLMGWRALVLVTMLALWYLADRGGWIDPLLSKSPIEVGDYLWEATRSGELYENTVATMSAVLIAFTLASVLGVLIGSALGLLPRVDAVVAPFMDAANSMPRIALAPVFIVWLGIGIGAKVALAFSIVIFVIMSSARAGVMSADPEIIRFSKVIGISRRQQFVKILLPVAVPSIFSGLRLGLVYALLGVISSEIIASRTGLGQLVIYYSGIYKLEAVYGILIVLAVIGAVLNSVTAFAESRLLRWRPTDHS